MSPIETVSQSIPTGTWKVDPAHSTVEFAVKHMQVATVKGRIADFDATLEGGTEPRLVGTIRTAHPRTGWARSFPPLPGTGVGPGVLHGDHVDAVRLDSVVDDELRRGELGDPGPPVDLAVQVRRLADVVSFSRSRSSVRKSFPRPGCCASYHAWASSMSAWASVVMNTGRLISSS